jgi:hypothetical protein
MKRFYQWAVASILAFNFGCSTQTNQPEYNPPPVPAVSPETSTIQPEPDDLPSSTPRKVDVTVSLSDPEDLKVKPGDQLEKGEIISDMTRRRTQLERTKKQLDLSLEQLNLPIPEPLPVADVELPPPDLTMETEAIKQAQLALQQAQESVAFQKAKLEATLRFKLPEMNAIDQAQGYSELLQLEQNRQSAALAIMQSVAARQAKQRDYQYQQYQQALEQQRNLMAYQRDVSSFVVNVQRVGVERNQLLTRLDEVETELEQASVFSPYAGVVRRVDVEQQSNDTLQARLVLDVEQ